MSKTSGVCLVICLICFGITGKNVYNNIETLKVYQDYSNRYEEATSDLEETNELYESKMEEYFLLKDKENSITTLIRDIEAYENPSTHLESYREEIETIKDSYMTELLGITEIGIAPNYNQDKINKEERLSVISDLVSQYLPLPDLYELVSLGDKEVLYKLNAYVNEYVQSGIQENASEMNYNIDVMNQRVVYLESVLDSEEADRDKALRIREIERKYGSLDSYVKGSELDYVRKAIDKLKMNYKMSLGTYSNILADSVEKSFYIEQILNEIRTLDDVNDYMEWYTLSLTNEEIDTIVALAYELERVVIDTLIQENQVQREDLEVTIGGNTTKSIAYTIKDKDSMFGSRLIKLVECGKLGKPDKTTYYSGYGNLLNQINHKSDEMTYFCGLGNIGNIEESLGLEGKDAYEYEEDYLEFAYAYEEGQIK